MNIKLIFIFLADLLFPLLQTGPHPGDGDDRVPIAGGIIYLVIAAIGLGIKAYTKKLKK